MFLFGFVAENVRYKILDEQGNQTNSPLEVKIERRTGFSLSTTKRKLKNLQKKKREKKNHFLSRKKSGCVKCITKLKFKDLQTFLPWVGFLTDSLTNPSSNSMSIDPNECKTSAPCGVN
jgi:hypothetical protein